MRIMLLLMIGSLVAPLLGAVEVREFDDLEKQTRYEHLLKEVRCLVCQNQSLGDSDAELAKDLRDEIYSMIQSGQSEEEAISFLTDRYGDFVLYRPPFKSITWLLWVGPALFILAGGSIAFWPKRDKNRQANPKGLTDEERLELDRLKRRID